MNYLIAYIIVNPAWWTDETHNSHQIIKAINEGKQRFLKSLGLGMKTFTTKAINLY